MATSLKPLMSSAAPVAIIGGGPAGLMAAEMIARAGFAVSIYDAMPSVGRKFLLAGVGGMNITHAESQEKFLTRYAIATPHLAPFIDAFDANALCDWVNALGVKTFVGSSGRVFPEDMKAAPLLRAWLHRLRELNVKIYPRHRWLGWAENGELLLQTSSNGIVGNKKITASATLLALGGASWQRLGSDGAWVDVLRAQHIQVNDLLPANCGFDIAWSEIFCEQFAGTQLSTITFTTQDNAGQIYTLRGEAIITRNGIEGTTVYALSAILREVIRQQGQAILTVDLLPDYSMEKIQQGLARPRGKNSISNFLRKQFNVPAVKIALLRECIPKSAFENPIQLAQSIKSVPLRLSATRPIDEAISSAGGIDFAELNPVLMLKKYPGIFCAGEMLDWEAPTGGYLLTACFATGRAAGLGLVNWLTANSHGNSL